MLISFKVENWKSFPLLEFSALAGKERLHNERVALTESPRMRLLPISAIYGGNASGKSNFFEAIDFARRYVVNGVAPERQVGVKPFALNSRTQKEPTRFVFELYTDKGAFRYSFTITRSEVVEESLSELLQTVERPLFERHGTQIELKRQFRDSRALEYVGRGTRKNLLFLTNCVHQQRDEFRAIYDWFQNTLLLISPSASCNAFEMYANERSPFMPQNQETLDEFDVGIERIETKPVPLNQLPFQVNWNIQKESESLPDGALFQLGPYLVSIRNGEPTVGKMVAIHSLEDDPSVKISFDLAEESDGTCRLLDLIPAFTFLRDPSRKRVIFIDEIDRSLHHLLTRKLIEDYLASCSPDSRSQLFFTTHDALLMDQSLLRRDELWLVEKDGARSSLVSVGDYQIRYDKSLVNSYLYGRFGGTPNLRTR